VGGIVILTKIMPWGNSQGLRIPKAILDLAKIKENDEVELIPQENAIIIKLPKVKNTTLEQLFANWDGEPPEKLEWWEQMKPLGKELI
jgi:antitoxin MazE